MAKASLPDAATSDFKRGYYSVEPPNFDPAGAPAGQGEGVRSVGAAVATAEPQAPLQKPTAG